MVPKLDREILLGSGLVVVLLILSAFLSYRNINQLDDDARWVAHTHEVLGLTGDLLLALVDAETGQRGFIITGKEEFIQPYTAALAQIEERMGALKDQTRDNFRQQERIEKLGKMTAALLALLKEGNDLRLHGEKEARAFVATGKSKKQMDSIRELVATMEQDENSLLKDREGRSRRAYHTAVTTGLLSTLMALALVIAFVWFLQRTLQARQQTTVVIHEQREWFRTTLASIGDAVIATDKEGRVSFLNQVAQSLTAWKEEEAQGKPLETVFHIVNEETRQSVENPALRALKEGKVVGLANHTLLISRDGMERPIDDSAAAIRDASGRITGSVLVFRDITERREAENALKDADRRKDEFLATLAHELRNPLAPIRNAVQVMRLAGNNQPAMEASRAMIERQVNQMVRLVDDLLDLTRISQGKVELRRERVELAAILATAIETSKPLIEQAGHALHVTLPTESVFVEGDPIRLAQVFLNLLNNAAKYTDQGGQISLVAEREGDFLAVRVRDNGVGISQQMLPRIFEMFTQVDQTMARTQGGLGIGLNLVRRLVNLHGGSIEAYSAGLGQGSEFIVRLALATD